MSSEDYGTGRIGLTSANRDDIFGGPIARAETEELSQDFYDELGIEGTRAESEYEARQNGFDQYLEETSETAMIPETGYKESEGDWNSEYGFDNQALFGE